jgi:hypothetical protein
VLGIVRATTWATVLGVLSKRVFFLECTRIAPRLHWTQRFANGAILMCAIVASHVSEEFSLVSQTSHTYRCYVECTSPLVPRAAGSPMSARLYPLAHGRCTPREGPCENEVPGCGCRHHFRPELRPKKVPAPFAMRVPAGYPRRKRAARVVGIRRGVLLQSTSVLSTRSWGCAALSTQATLGLPLRGTFPRIGIAPAREGECPHELVHRKRTRPDQEMPWGNEILCLLSRSF